MSNASIFSNLLYPQVKVIENQAVSNILPLASFSFIYVFGDSASGVKNQPTIVSSYTDFVNQFGNYEDANAGNEADVKIVADSIKVIFKNDPTANVYFIRVADGSGSYEPALADYITAIDTLTVEDEYPAGFLLAPSAGGIPLVGNALKDKAEELDFMAFVDSDRDLMLQTTKPTTTEIQADADRYQNSPTGHVAYYYPYVYNATDADLVPGSVVAASIATARYKSEGYKPNGGFKFIAKGVGDPVWPVTNAEQSVLDPVGINALRKFRGQGTLVYGMRTRQSNLLYRYIHARVIANVVNNTFRKSMELKLQLFDIVDGKGKVLAFIEDAAYSVGRQLYQGGFLFGASETDAFEVKCDLENNTEDQLQQGNVLVEFTYAVSPAIEKLVVSTRLTSLGSLGEAQDSVG